LLDKSYCRTNVPNSTGVVCFNPFLVEVQAVKAKGKVMNKAMLIERLAKSTGEQKAVCKRVVEEFIETVGQELKAGRQIVLTGFGTFVATMRKARKGINPITGKPMSIPAKRVPKFRAGKSLKAQVAK
jgi:DNA-binding protein HU-beta